VWDEPVVLLTYPIGSHEGDDLKVIPEIINYNSSQDSGVGVKLPQVKPTRKHYLLNKGEKS